MGTPPLAVVDQRRHALDLANKVRCQRGALRARFKRIGRHDACIEAAALIENPPTYLATLRLEDLLSRIPTLGAIKATGRGGRGVKQRRWMRQCDIPRSAALGQLTVRQRLQIAEIVRAYADKNWWQNNGKLYEANDAGK